MTHCKSLFSLIGPKFTRIVFKIVKFVVDSISPVLGCKFIEINLSVDRILNMSVEIGDGRFSNTAREGCRRFVSASNLIRVSVEMPR